MLSSLFLIQKLIHESFMMNLFRKIRRSVRHRNLKAKEKDFFFCFCFKKENFKIEMRLLLLLLILFLLYKFTQKKIERVGIILDFWQQHVAIFHDTIEYLCCRSCQWTFVNPQMERIYSKSMVRNSINGG